MTRLRERLLVVAAAIVALGAAAPPRSISHATIVVDVAALDDTGAAVLALSPSAVEVLVDNVAVPVLSVTPAPSALNLVVVVDHSSSVPVRRTDLINAIGGQWLPLLVQGDRARLALVASPVSFGPWLPVGRPADTNLARSLLDRAGAEPSPIWDAIDAAAQLLAGSKAPRAVIVISDGRATGNALGLEEVRRGRPRLACRSRPSAKRTTKCCRKAPMLPRACGPMRHCNGSRMRPAACTWKTASRAATSSPAPIRSATCANS